jgi:hypothetical protein
MSSLILRPQTMSSEKLKFPKEICHSATVITTNLKPTTQALNPILRSNKSGTAA